MFSVINIFKRISDPIRFDNTNYKYLLFADQMNEENTEIYTIDKIIKWQMAQTRILLFIIFFV